MATIQIMEDMNMNKNEFLKTEEGRKFTAVLEGVQKDAQIYYYEDLEQYIMVLKANGWNDEDISDQVIYIMKAWYKYSTAARDFVEVVV